MSAVKRIPKLGEIDRQVGARVRELRIQLGLSQQQFGDLIGVSYQQARKYERGINRISAGTLFQMAQILRVPVGYFFDESVQHDLSKNPHDRMLLTLVRHFNLITNEQHQKALLQMAEALVPIT